MRVASFFSGIGGFELGFERAGMEVVFQCEINKFNQQILNKHWPNITFHEDINTLNVSQIPESDLWCGGFPCQDVSLANQGKREGLKGERSGLFFKFRDLIRERCPRWVILENVPGLLNSQQGEGLFRVVIGALDKLGYGVAWRVLDAKFFGTPQRRRRVFIVASYQSPSAAQVLFNNERITIPTETSQRQKEALTKRFGNSDKPANIYAIQNAAIGRVHTSGPQGKGYRSDGETWTFDSRGSGDAVCSPSDSFRIREASGISRKMDGHRYRSLGNAVNVFVAEWIGCGIMEVEQ